jgi:hypothetical protein
MTTPAPLTDPDREWHALPLWRRTLRYFMPLIFIIIILTAIIKGAIYLGPHVGTGAPAPIGHHQP